MSITEDKAVRKTYQKKCLEVKKYVIGKKYSVDCNLDYQHFNSKAFSKFYKKSEATSVGKVRITSFNMLHPGSLRTAFKDLELVSKIMNEWDLVSVLELLPVLGRDNRHNESIIDFLERGPSLVEDLKSKIQKITFGPELSDLSPLIELKNELSEIETSLKSAKELYRGPGYIKILTELRKLDPSWSLLLTPRGEAAEETHVHELVGFFYRSSRVKPIENEHCKEFKFDKVKPFACIPNLRKNFMERDTTNVFSRRPFLSSFESGKFDFTLIASHVVYGSPDEPEKMKQILGPSFGVNTYEDIGKGVTKQTYARWAEAKIILELMTNLREYYYEQDIIYAGDMNLEAVNSYFSTLFKEFPGEELLIKDQTTLSQPRFHSQGMPTNGMSNNYDHFIFNRKHTRECLSSSNKITAKVIPFYKGTVESFIKKNYLIRKNKEFNVDEIIESISEDFKEKVDYVMLPGAATKVKSAQKHYRTELLKLRKVKNDRIVVDDYRVDERVELFKKRVFMDQLTNQYYYRVYLELVSDHFPITMNCRTKLADDDE